MAGEIRQEITRLRSGTMGEAPPARHPYHVEINRVGNGFIVTVGCKTFVSESWNFVSKALGEYWEDPEAAQRKYCR